jgi:hypothetical protein
MKTKLILLLGIVIIYVFFINKVEKMTDTTNTTDQIKEAVKQIYLADVEAIRNLSNVATKLQSNGLNIPGTLTAADLNIANGNASGVFKFGSKASINSLGDINGNSLTVSGNMVGNKLQLNNDLTITGRLYTPDGHTIQCKGRQHITGDSELYVLNKFGLIVGKEWGGNGNASIQGDLSVNGNLTVKGDTSNAKNRARYIRVGNMYTIDIPNFNTGKMRTSDVSSLSDDYWTLIEIRVFDNTCENVSEKKSVTQIFGTPYLKSVPLNITNGVARDASYTNGYHGGTGKHLLEIDLGKEYDIDRIELYNRFNNENHISKRMDGTIVELINDSKTMINRTIHTGLWYTTYSKEYIL